MRALIDSYGMLAIPMAAFFSGMQKYGRNVFVGATLVATLLIAQNLFHIRKYKTNAIHWDSMSKEAYWETFGKQHATVKYYNLLEPPDYDGEKYRGNKK